MRKITKKDFIEVLKKHISNNINFNQILDILISESGITSIEYVTMIIELEAIYGCIFNNDNIFNTDITFNDLLILINHDYYQRGKND